MQVDFIGDLDHLQSVDIDAGSIKEILALLKLRFGHEFTDLIIKNEYYYVVMRDDDPDSMVALMPDVVMSDLSGYDRLMILPKFEGQFTAAVLAALGTALVSAGGVIGAIGAFVAAYAGILATILNLALSIGLSMLTNALSGTPEVSPGQDPASVQRNVSNLFNGSAIVREQGGPVPFGFGEPFHGGTMISSGIFSEKISA